MADDVKQKLFTLRILWGAMLSSTVMFVVVLFIVRQQGQASTDEPMAALPIVLGLMAVVDAAGSLLVPRLWYRKILANKSFDFAEEAQPGAFGQYREGSPTQRVFKEPREAFNTALALYMTPVLLGMAFGESVSIFGLVIGMTGHPWPVALPFFLVGSALVAEKYPSIGFITKQLEAAHDAKMPT